MGAGKDKNAYVGFHLGFGATRPDFHLRIHHDATEHADVEVFIDISTARLLASVAETAQFDELLLQATGHSIMFSSELRRHPEMARSFRALLLATASF